MELHGSLLIYRPRRDKRLSWPSWLTHSGRLTHEVVTRQPWIMRRSGKVRQPKNDVLTTDAANALYVHDTIYGHSNNAVKVTKMLSKEAAVSTFSTYFSRQ